MGGRSSRKVVVTSESAEEFLKVSIDYPNFKLDVTTASPAQTMGELRKILEAMPAETVQTLPDDIELAELRARLSEEFFNHQDLLARMRSSLILDEEVRIIKQVLPILQEYDLSTGEQVMSLSATSIKQSLLSMFEGIDRQGIRECLVHIRGDLRREQQCVVMDCFKQLLAVEGRVRFYSTKKNLEGKVLVEAVCFGEGVGDGE